MTISVNGEPVELAEAISVRELLLRRQTRLEFVAVAVNGTCVPRGEQSATALRDGDQVEILTPHGGG